MTELIAVNVWLALAAYAAIGGAVALWLLAGGLKRLDEGAVQAPFYVKALWTPGLVALWPILLVRLRKSPPEDSL